jgi:diacylglycerol kinase family enzyme
MTTNENQRAAVRELAPDEIPVAAGGDGTVNSLVRALREEGRDDIPVGVIPLGTGNTFAFSVGIKGLEDAAAALARGDRLAVDVMVTTDAEYRVALVSLSTGFESRVARSLADARGWRRHVRAPLALAGGASRTTLGIELDVDGRAVIREGQSVFNAGLYNTPYYGRGRVVIPGSLSTDGVAEAVIHDNGRSYLGSLLRGVHRGRADPGPQVHLYRWTTARIQSSSGMQLDGEAVARESFDVCLEPGALWVLVPGPPDELAHVAGGRGA